MIEIWKGRAYINKVENEFELRRWIIKNVAPLKGTQLKISEDVTQYEAECIARKRGLAFKTIKNKPTDKSTL